jgi:integrase
MRTTMTSKKIPKRVAHSTRSRADEGVRTPEPKGKRTAPLRFSDTYLKTLKPPPGQRELIQFEAGTGLGVRVSANNISFIVQTRLKDGRRWRETLKPWGAMTIEDARSIAQERSADAARIGEEGDLFKRRANAATQARLSALAKQFTLRALVDRWGRKHLVNRAPGYAKRSVSGIERVFKKLLDRPATLITKEEVGDALDLVTGPGAARQAAVALLAAYNWAVSEDCLPTNPLASLKLPPLPPPRDRVLNAAELRRIWAAACRLPYPSGAFVKLLLLSAARLNEIARLKWDEIETGDSGLKTIMLAADRTKTSVKHAIPLSDVALDVLADCARHRVVGCRFVFSSDGHRALNNSDRVKKALDAEIATDGGPPVPHFVFHSFRHAFATLTTGEDFNGGEGFDAMAVDRQLGHTPVKLRGVAARYNHQQFLPTRRRILAGWGPYVSRPPADVVVFKRERERERQR